MKVDPKSIAAPAAVDAFFGPKKSMKTAFAVGAKSGRSQGWTCQLLVFAGKALTRRWNPKALEIFELKEIPKQ